MSLLRIGRFQNFIKLGLVLCLSIFVVVFYSWKCVHDGTPKLDVDRTKTTSVLSNSHDGPALTRQSVKHNIIQPRMSPSKSIEKVSTFPKESAKFYAVTAAGQRNLIKEAYPTISKQEDIPAKFILLMSYMRSGSSMTSELLQQSEYTFFMFEPFWGIYGSAHRRRNSVCDQYLRSSCKDPSGMYQSEGGNLIVMEDLFNCRFKHLPVGVLESFAVFYPNTGYNASRSCFPKGVKKYPGSHYRAILKSKVKPMCIDILEEMCQRAKVRLIKTIRLPLSFAENILRRMPDLKIVHLLRDPRGMIHSRSVINYVNLSYGSAPVKRLCSWMEDDLEDVKQLILKFNERIVILLYDCLVVNPFKITELLHQYLDLEYNNNVVNWVSSHMNSNSFKEEEFVKAGNSDKISTVWRTTIDFDSVQLIDRSCETVYKMLGLRKFENVQDLRNIKISNVIDLKQCQNKEIDT